MTSTLLYKTQCPSCNDQGKDKSRDNLAVYSDGHSYCYSCGYVTTANLSRIKNTKKDTQLVNLPEDIQDIFALPNDIPSIAINWLLNYFKYKEIPKFTFWSNSKQSLIFPIYDNPNHPTTLLAYQARYFGNNLKYPKWIGYGINNSLVFSYGKNKHNTTVLVEDLISTYKVGHVQHTTCLFGSHIGAKRLVTLALLGYTTIYIWLDYDKRIESIKEASLGQSLGLSMKVIHTKKDPKEYSYEEIQEILK